MSHAMHQATADRKPSNLIRSTNNYWNIAKELVLWH